MTNFYIADFLIDLSRSVVIKGEQQTQVEPKVLKVLLCLAERPNEVVTHQAIMEHAWPDTEVVPNALQRCIAILRKVLGDDAKEPHIIATHPRIGYRLLAEVRWQHRPEPQADEALPEPAPQRPAGNRKWPKALLALSVLVLVGILAGFWLQPRPVQYTRIHPLTQTDAHESHALYSPNGDYVIFNRHANACKSHLWARQVTGGKERRLTSEPGYFGAVSFTADGRELVFAARAHCGQPASEPGAPAGDPLCWNIATLDFARALAMPQQPDFRHQCQAERLENPKALSNHRYAFLQYDGARYHLMQYDDLSKQLSSLHSPDALYLYHFDYDPRQQRFAVMSRDSEFNTVLQLLDRQGQVLSQARLKLPPGMSRNLRFSANFEPQGQYLLATSHNRLYRIDFDGRLQWLKTPEANLVSVARHPVTQDLLAIRGKKYIDIAQLTLGESPASQATAGLNRRSLPFPSLARTTGQERQAKYQPYGERIAFVSDRSGEDQLWLWHQGQASQLSFVPSHTGIRNFSWSPDGTQLAWVSDDRLAIMNLQGEVRFVDTEKPLDTLLAWYGDKQFLVGLNDPQPGGLYRLDLAQNTLSAVGINRVEAAWVHRQQLIYSNERGEVFTRPLEQGNDEARLLPGLNGRAMILSEEFIYSVDPKSFVLGQYDMRGERIKPVMPLKGLAWKITDLKDNHLLLSQFIAINHDIVRLE